MGASKEMKNALLFPGQGVQYAGMGKKLYDSFAIVRKIFDQASEAAGADLKKLCFEGSREELRRTENTQPAVLTVSFGAFQVLSRELGYEFAYLAGHSLGEITALCAGGAIAFADAVRLVQLRGRLMQQAATGKMCAVTGKTADDLRRLCAQVSAAGDWVQISNYNAPRQTVLAGDEEGIKKAVAYLAAEGVRTVELNVSAPFHSRLMEPAAGQFREALRLLSMAPLQIPVVSGVTGAVYADEGRIKDILALQLLSPVEWTKVIAFLRMSGVSCLLDAGPGVTMKNLVTANNPALSAIAVDDSKEPFFGAASAPGAASGVSSGIKWENGREYLQICLGLVVSARNEGTDAFLKPYGELKAILSRYAEDSSEPAISELKAAYQLVCEIGKAKRLSQEEYAMLTEPIMLQERIYDED